MNQNRPFYSTNTNLYDEFFRSSAPTTLNGENVILSQEQQRRVCDTLNTSIVGSPFGITGNQQMLCAQKQYFPGGVLFTFPSSISAPPNVTHGACCKCTPVSAPIMNDFNHFHQTPAAVNTFFPSSMEYQHMHQGCGVLGNQPPPSKEPFRLKFHHDRSTSLSDLLSYSSQVPPSKGLPDLSNLNGILQQSQNNQKKCHTTAPELFFPSPPIEFSSNAKKLVLSKCAPPLCGHVVDVLNEDENATNEDDVKKKVSFSDSKDPAVTEDKSSQMTSECVCEEKKCKNAKSNKRQDHHERQKRKSKKVKNQKSNTSSETTMSSDSEGDCDKSKKNRWWEHQKKSEIGSSDTQSSDSEEEKTKKGKRKKKRKKGKGVNEKEVSGSDSHIDKNDQPESAPENDHSEQQ